MRSFRIGQVARVTGLSEHVLRVWEKRYGLLQPLRRGNNRYRLYSREEVDLLLYLKQEIDGGQSIGDLAALGREELIRRMREETAGEEKKDSPDWVQDLLDALSPLDKNRFEERLRRFAAWLPFEDLFQRILVPLQIGVGEHWHEGKISSAVEHYVTRLVRNQLSVAMNQLSQPATGPRVVVACPPWEQHEIGAQLVAYFCARKGCQVYFLGGDLPLQDLIGFCKMQEPDCVLLSLVAIPKNNWVRELTADFKNRLSSIKLVLAGGPGAVETRPILEAGGIKVLDSLSALDAYL